MADGDMSPGSSGDKGAQVKAMAAQTLARNPNDGLQRGASPATTAAVSQSSSACAESSQQGGNELSVTRYLVTSALKNVLIPPSSPTSGARTDHNSGDARSVQARGMVDYHQHLLKMRLEGGLEGIEIGPVLGRGSYGRIYKGSRRLNNHVWHLLHLGFVRPRFLATSTDIENVPWDGLAGRTMAGRASGRQDRG